MIGNQIPFETYDDILQARNSGQSTNDVSAKFGVSTSVVQAVWRCFLSASTGDLANFERQKGSNFRVYRWATKFLPAEHAESSQLPLPSPAPGLNAAAITEKAMALLSKSLDEDGESSDFLRGVLALYKALTASGAEM